MRWFVDLAYRGAPYHGWQVQPGQCTVQGELERVYGIVLRRPTAVTGAGRTDTGVNARHMVAHIDTDTDISSPAAMRAVNSLLGPDIAVYAARRVADGAHARFDATARTYRYFVTTRKNPFARQMAWQAPRNLDFDAMNRAGHLLTTLSDFTSFARLHSDNRTNICRLDHAAWHAADEHYWYFEIRADRFLRNMVRAVAGTLIDVGRGKMPPEAVLDIAAKMNRCAAGTSMPAEPLFLWKVDYPEGIYI